MRILVLTFRTHEFALHFPPPFPQIHRRHAARRTDRHHGHEGRLDSRERVGDAGVIEVGEERAGQENAGGSRRAPLLTRVGADFLISPDNTIHAAFGLVKPRSPLPWLHIAEVAAEEARAKGYKRLGITGTKWLVDSEVYPESLSAAGLNYRLPRSDDHGGQRQARDGIVR